MFGRGLQDLSAMENANYLDFKDKNWRSDTEMTFDWFTVEPDMEARAACNCYPWYQLTQDPRDDERFEQMSVWCLQACDLLSRRAWTEWERERLDMRLIDRANATLAHLEICDPSESPEPTYDFQSTDPRRALRLCKEATKGHLPSTQSEVDTIISNLDDPHCRLFALSCFVSSTIYRR